MIPKIIHYCWFGKSPLPREVKKCIKSWKKYCPDYEIIQWNEDNFDVNEHSFTRAAYKEKAWAFVSDYARLKILYENGGIYFDTDVELIKNIDFLLKNECYLGRQQNGNKCNTGIGFGCEKNSNIIRTMLEIYDNVTFNAMDKMNVACPRLNSIALEKYGFVYENRTQELEGVTVYEAKYFDPIAPNSALNIFCSETISIHHYSASWESKKVRIKRKISNFIGQDKVNKMKYIIKNKVVE